MSVLVVEDDHVVRQIIEMILSASGLKVTAVATGEEAAVLLEQGEIFTLLLTDVHLPGHYDGWSMAVEARRHLQDIPVVYITSSEQPSHPVNGSVYLRKPVTPKLLLKVVGTLLGRELRVKSGSVQTSQERIGGARYVH